MSEIATIRRQLQAASAREPDMHRFIDLLDTQLRNFERENDEGKAALRLIILANIKQFEAARGDGRSTAVS